MAAANLPNDEHSGLTAESWWITVVYLTGECIDFKLRRDVPMRNVSKAFAQPRTQCTLKFPHNGKFIGGDKNIEYARSIL
jgi:hypothetical protein